MKKIDTNKIDTNKTDGWYEFINFYFWYFRKIVFRFQKKLCNVCHDMTQNPWVLMILNLLLSEEIIKGLTWWCQTIVMSDNIPETMMEQKSHCKKNRETCLYKGKGCYEKHKERLQKMACSQ